MPMFSIIVPVYNVEKYIKKCLESIYKQTFKDFEVIIVNDGTKDNSREIICNECIFDNRFKLYDKENGGLSSARNEGMKHAKGSYVVFIDSDDWIMEDYLERISNTITDNADVLICHYYLDDTIIGDCYIPYENEKTNKEYTGKEKEKEIIQRHLIAYPQNGYEIKDTIMPVWKNVYRRELLTNFDIWFISERQIMLEDYVFNLNSYYAAKCVQVSDIAGYVHVIVPGTLSRSYRHNGIEMAINRHQMLETFFSEHAFSSIDSIREAEMSNFACSIASNVRNLCLSKQRKKVKKIKQILNIKEVQDVFTSNIDKNLLKNQRITLSIFLTKKVYLYIVLFKALGKVNRLYRLYQRRTRK